LPVLVSLHALLLILLSFLSSAQGAEDPFRVEAQDLALSPGGSGRVTVIVRVPEGFHVYRDMLSVDVIRASALKTSAVSFPPGEMAPDPASPGALRELYEQDVYVEVPVTAPSGVMGPQTVSFDVRYQGCKKALCYMPGEQEVSAVVTVGASRPGLPGGGPEADEVPVHFSSGTPAAGKAVLKVDLQGEWHINRDLFTITATNAGGWTVGDAQIPRGKKTGNEADGSAREDLMADFEVVLPVSGSGPDDVVFDVWYQACKGVSLCKMPTTEQVHIKMPAAGAAATPAVTAPPAPPAQDTPVAETPAAVPAPTVVPTVPAPPVVAMPPAAKAASGTDKAFAAAADQGFFSLLVLCFIAGIGVSFTPCVLPVVPITMGIIGARSAGSRLKAFTLALTYVLGQATVYTSLAVLVAGSGDIFGTWLQYPAVTGIISLFFVAMGLSMFGFFDFQVPSALQSRLQGNGPKGGYAGAAVLGVIGALLAGPCSGPIVASILVVIGVNGKVGEGALLMFTFSMGMGMIFLVTGALAGWLPSRGMWMDLVKKGMGIFLWLMAVYFSASHLSVTVTALLTAAVLLVTGVFAWPNPDDGEEILVVRSRQLYSVVASIVGGYLLLGTLATEGFILPPVKLSAASTTSAPTATAGIHWRNDHDAALAEAKASGKPILIDFTAEWCAACHEMEKLTYTDASVIETADGFVTVMIDCTQAADPQIKALQARYGVSGLPTVALVDTQGNQVDTVIGFVEAPDFLKRLKAVLPQKAGG